MCKLPRATMSVTCEGRRAACACRLLYVRFAVAPASVVQARVAQRRGRTRVLTMPMSTEYQCCKLCAIASALRIETTSAKAAAPIWTSRSSAEAEMRWMKYR